MILCFLVTSLEEVVVAMVKTIMDIYSACRLLDVSCGNFGRSRLVKVKLTGVCLLKMTEVGKCLVTYQAW